MKKMVFSVLVLLFAVSAWADIYTYPAESPVMTISFPDDWKVEPEEEIIHANPADETLYVGVWALNSVEDMEGALEALAEEIDDFVRTADFDDPEVEEINAIEFVFVEGSGETHDEIEADITIVIFTTNGYDYFIGFVFGTPDSFDEYEDDLDFILESIDRYSEL